MGESDELSADIHESSASDFAMGTRGHEQIGCGRKCSVHEWNRGGCGESIFSDQASVVARASRPCASVRTGETPVPLPRLDEHAEGAAEVVGMRQRLKLARLFWAPFAERVRLLENSLHDAREKLRLRAK